MAIGPLRHSLGGVSAGRPHDGQDALLGLAKRLTDTTSSLRASNQPGLESTKWRLRDLACRLTRVASLAAAPDHVGNARRLDPVRTAAEHLVDYLTLLTDRDARLGDAELRQLVILADTQREQLMLLEALDRDMDTFGERTADETNVLVGLQEVALAYATDALSARGTASKYRLAGLGTIGLAIAVCLLGLTGWHLGTLTGSSTSLFYRHLIAAGFISLASFPILWLAERHRRRADELSRLERQFGSVGIFLAPLPKDMRAVVQATLTPRLFSRILEDDDPVREPIWPTAAELLSTAALAVEDISQPPPDSAVRLRRFWRRDPK